MYYLKVNLNCNENLLRIFIFIHKIKNNNNIENKKHFYINLIVLVIKFIRNIILILNLILKNCNNINIIYSIPHNSKREVQPSLSADFDCNRYFLPSRCLVVGIAFRFDFDLHLVDALLEAFLHGHFTCFLVDNELLFEILLAFLCG